MSIILKELIKELIVKDLSDSNEDSKWIAAWKDKLFIIGKNSKDIDSLIQHFEEHPAIKKYNTTHPNNLLLKSSDIFEIFDTLSEYIPDGIFGTWNPISKDLALRFSETSLKSSPYLLKVVKALGVKTVRKYTVNDDEIKTSRRNIRGKLPTRMFHGTSSEFLENILRNGILPPDESGTETNWKNFQHEGIIFMASEITESFYYAFTTSYQKGGFAVVIETVVPDPSKIIPDLDADPERVTSQYSGFNPHDYYDISAKPSTMTKHTGKIGYLGKILPQHIQWIYFKVGEHGYQLKKIKPKTFLKLWDRFGDEMEHWFGIYSGGE